MTELTVQYGGWPRACLCWVTQAGYAPPDRDWRGRDWKEAVGAALVSLGLTEARVTRVPDTDDHDDRPDEDWGVVTLAETAPTPITPDPRY